MALSGRLCLLTALALLASLHMSTAAPVAKSVPAFNTVRICVPFNVLISPSSGADQYQVVLDADSSVGQALQASVSNDVLSLGVSGSFQTSNPIKLTVRRGRSCLVMLSCACFLF
jgi:hypothetical protein